MFENFKVDELLDENGYFLTIDKDPQVKNTIDVPMTLLMEFTRLSILDILARYYNKLSTGKKSPMDTVDKKAKYLMDRVLLELNLTRELAAGIAGNIYEESKFNPKAVGDKGAAHGIAQWHPDRRKGVNMLNLSFEDLVTYLIDELKNSEKNALAILRLTETPEQAAAIFDEKYERSKGLSRKARLNMAVKYFNTL